MVLYKRPGSRSCVWGRVNFVEDGLRRPVKWRSCVRYDASEFARLKSYYGYPNCYPVNHYLCRYVYMYSTPVDLWSMAGSSLIEY